MVVFSCNACGQSLKKKEVEKHYLTQCRQCEVLSCLDCNKDFKGDEYKSHVRCISEDQKYGGKNYTPKPNSNKGQKMQDDWIETVRKAASQLDCDPKLQNFLKHIMNLDNVPRKKKKFENFIKNAGLTRNEFDLELVEKSWNVLSNAWESEKKKKTVNGKATEENATANGSLEKQKADSIDNGGKLLNGSNDSSAKKKNRKRKTSKNTDLEKPNEIEEEKKADEKESQKSNTECEEPKKKKRKGKDGGTEKGKQNQPNMAEPLSQDEPNREKHKSKDAKSDKKETKDTCVLSEFKWRKAAKSILMATPEKAMPITKLKKKLYKQYKSSDEKAQKDMVYSKIDQELFKQKFLLENDVVKFVE